jgi:hypothetical protein
MEPSADPRDDRLEAVLSRLQGVRKSGSGFMARCPAHQDDSPSLSVGVGEKGILLYCWSGCSVQSVLASLELRWQDLFFQDKGTLEKKKAPLDRRGLELEALMAASRLQSESEVLEKARRLRGWAAPALLSLGVGWDGERFTLPVKDAENRLHDVLRYNPYSSKWKMLAGEGRTRQIWPRPEDVSTTNRSRGLYVVEGEGTAISLASIGLPVVALPGAVARASGDVRNPSRFEGVGWHKAWAKRFKGHGRLWLFPDADDVGRTVMLTAHFDLEKEGLHPVICDLGGDEGFDLGDLLAAASHLELRRQGKELVKMFARVSTSRREQIPEARSLLHAWHEWQKAPAPVEEFVGFSW